MCGRYALHSRPEVIALAFGLAEMPAFAPRYNVAPTAEVPIITARGAMLARWGLIPHWAKDASIGPKLCNARAETVAEKPAFRDAYRERRCLVPADGFFEWRQEGARKQPYYLRPARSPIFAFAGLWETWRGPSGPVASCTIITTEANALVRPLHDRMPVIIPPEDFARWLEGGARASALLRPCAEDMMRCHRVSSAVNDARNDSPQLVAPVEGGAR